MFVEGCSLRKEGRRKCRDPDKRSTSKSWLDLRHVGTAHCHEEWKVTGVLGVYVITVKCLPANHARVVIAGIPPEHIRRLSYTSVEKGNTASEQRVRPGPLDCGASHYTTSLVVMCIQCCRSCFGSSADLVALIIPVERFCDVTSGLFGRDRQQEQMFT